MSALFPAWTNTAAKVTLLMLFGAPLGGITLLLIYVRSPLFLRQHDPIEQPVQFDHRHHVADDGIDCRYCHDGATRSASAGVPDTAVCMSCHAQIWNKSPLLSLVRGSFYSGRPIAWRRVHQLPDFVYFNHAIHVAKGVGCSTCHGEVAQMAAIEQVAPLTMGWCLDCHRAPERFLRPREAITKMDYHPDRDQAALGRELAARYQVHTRTSCTTCHR